MPDIKILPTNLINQIAAGEVIERPAAALKELIENSLDAGATQIDISIREGGKSFLSVSDNGTGIVKDQIHLAVERHATSKMDSHDLFSINTFGFRGEALASIGSVARLRITSRADGFDDAWSVSVEGGVCRKPEPCNHIMGTRVDVSDLFFATPARLKFLKSTAQENKNITDTIEKLALKNCHVGFSCVNDGRAVLSFKPESLLERVAQIVGDDFRSNCIDIDHSFGEYKLTGLMGYPTLNKNTSVYQYFYVNGRYIKDKLFSQCLKLAYQDLMPSDRFPMAVVFLSLPYEDVDVNVHPAKTEVRFRDNSLLKDFFLKSFKGSLRGMEFKTASIPKADLFKRVATYDGDGYLSHYSRQHSRQQDQFKNTGENVINMQDYYKNLSQVQNTDSQTSVVVQSVLEESLAPNSLHVLNESCASDASDDVQKKPEAVMLSGDFSMPPLGFAKAQILDTFILSENHEGMVLIDQHAVHERIIYESLKNDYRNKGVKRQAMVVPQVINLNGSVALILKSRCHELLDFGLLVEPFGGNSFLIREVPHALNGVDWGMLVEDVANSLSDGGGFEDIEKKVLSSLSSRACHGSIRAGKKMSVDEMNAMLREMEKVAFTGQCNHGRPTYIVLSHSDLDKLFHRS